MVTVVILVTKGTPNLKKTLESVLRQTYRQIEILLLVSGISGEGTLFLNRLIKQEERVHFIHLPSQPVSRLKQRAIQESRGNYLLFLEETDWIDEDYLESYLYQIQEQERKSGVTVDWLVSGKMLIAENQMLRVPFYEYDRFVEGQKALLKEQLNSSFLPTQITNQLIEKKVLQKCVIEEREEYEDICFLYQIALHAKNLLIISDFKSYQESAHSIEVLRKKQMLFQGSLLPFLQRLERTESYMRRMEQAQEESQEDRIRLQRIFLQNALQLLIIQPGSKEERKKENNRIKKIQEYIWKTDFLLQQETKQAAAVLSLKERMLLKYPGMGRFLYRKIRRLEEKNPEKYQRYNKKLDTFIERTQKSSKTDWNLPKGKEKRIFLIGTPEYHNLGDHAIAFAEKKFAECCFPERIPISVTEDMIQKNFKAFCRLLRKDDILFLQGGGNMGSEYTVQEAIRTKVISGCRHQKIVLMPQTLYFRKNKENLKQIEKLSQLYGQHKKLLLAAREEVSFQLMKHYFGKNRVVLCPDIVLSLGKDRTLQNTKTERAGEALLVLRSDSEGILNASQILEIKKLAGKRFSRVRMSETSISYSVKEAQRERELRKKWEEFQSAGIVITDRLHGFIFAAITGTPCVVLSNYNHKLSSSFRFLEELPFMAFCKEISELENAMERVLEEKSTEREITSSDAGCLNYLSGYYENLRDEIRNL